MEEKAKILQELGFSKEFIQALNQMEKRVPSLHTMLPNEESLEFNSNDTNEIIIKETDKPESFVYTSI